MKKLNNESKFIFSFNNKVLSHNRNISRCDSTFAFCVHPAWATTQELTFIFDEEFSKYIEALGYKHDFC
ncbi:hypothetical protein KQI86_16295 [Clostridium sp. MSJ-11]|uniref:Uncharacterized protein n=1 Tax=Clostridium mobile TaxID=2841512 RepID=A0ABS6EKZ8_9CLOT|nr:hypothetical protein [Clostridium mobile]MBU5485882.1 hypothetical protein [Clostridium mobile]